VNLLTLPTSLVRRALDDLSEIADAARRLTSLEAGVLGGLSRMETQLAGLRADLAPMSELSRVREGIEPLDEDMHAVRESVDDLEPLLREVNQRLERLDGRIEALREDLSPLGDLADKLPGVGRR
jgi:chromosome segregation ATPase